MRCTAKSKTSQLQCKRHSVPGLDKCRIHCGLSPTVAAEKGQKNLTVIRIGELLTEIHPDEEFDDPLTGLQVEIMRSAVAVDVLGRMVSELDELVAPSRKVVAKGHGEDAERTITAGDPKVHVLVELWNDERERHARFCKLAIDAGLEERFVKVQERQAAMLVAVISAALDDPELGLDTEQRQKARKVFGTHLRALPSAG